MLQDLAVEPTDEEFHFGSASTSTSMVGYRDLEWTLEANSFVKS